MQVPMKLLSFALALGLTATVSVAQETKPAELPSAPSSTLEKPKPQPPPDPPQQQAAPVQAAPPLAQPQTAATTPKQDEPPQKDDQDQPLTTIKASVDEVNLVFTVTDKHGKFVKDLKKEDFRVSDDNKPPKQIVGFTTETNLPLRVGLLVDASNSIRDRFRFEQEAAIEFLNQIVRPKSDRAFVIGFDTTAEITQDYTDSTELLSKGVRMLRPGGGTALFDALYFACRDKLMKSSSNTS